MATRTRRSLIINVRGANGSGKTQLVRRVLEQFEERKAIHLRGRVAPIGYICRNEADDAPPLFVVGSYEHAVSGGCDTIPKVDVMYATIRKYADRGYDVLYEGILAQHSTPRILELHEAGHRVRIVVLDIPLRKAIRGVKRRRRARGNRKPFDPINVVREERSVLNSAQRLHDAGVRVWYPKTRAKALTRVLKLLGL